jgi:hypothetical protein
MQYVRLEFPGIAFQPDQEINGLTMGGVGDSTRIDYIQVSFCGDDSFEWFGGTVNNKYLIAYKGLDDDFDTDFGFAGRVQFAVGLRDPALADISGSHGFESDNYGMSGINPSNPAADMPYTSAVFSNVTILGPLATPGVMFNANYRRNAHLRRNTRKQIHNTVMAGYPVGILIEGASVDNAKNGDLKITHSVIAGASAPNQFFQTIAADTAKNWRPADEAAWFLDSRKSNDTLTSNASLGFTDAFRQTGRPNFLLAPSSILLRGSYWDNFVSVKEITPAAQAQIKVFPNPTTDVVYLETDLNIKTVLVANMMGQVVRQINLTANNFSLQGLSTGTYILVLATNDGKRYSQRIVKR